MLEEELRELELLVVLLLDGLEVERAGLDSLLVERVGLVVCLLVGLVVLVELELLLGFDVLVEDLLGRSFLTRLVRFSALGFLS